MTTAPEPPQGGDDMPSIPEDVWEKFAEDSYGKIRATAPKEPSARARVVTARLREQDARAVELERARRFRLRRRGKGHRGPQEPEGHRGPQEPEGWRTGPAWREMRRGERGSWREWARTSLIVAVVLLGLLVAMNPSAALSLISGGGSASARAPLPQETALPSAAPPTPALRDIPTIQHPFAGSPAERWANGADGIVVPAAKRVGGLTSSQVAAGLQAAKAYLVAANLDPSVLRGSYPQAAVALIDPLQRKELDEIKTALSAPDSQHDPAMWFTRYNPTEAKLVGPVIKVRGEMKFSRKDAGSVMIHADYTFVYPFTRVRGATGEVARVIVRRVVDFEVSDPALVKATAGKLWITSNESSGDESCGTHDGLMHPFASDDATYNGPTGPTIDPYDRSKPLDQLDHGCHIDSRA